MTRIQGNLQERTFSFALLILELVDELPNNTKGWVLCKQLTRSGTSIGANVCEANNASSDADFANKCSIARKEASETCYWLRLCESSGLLRSEKAMRAKQEADELAKILSTMVFRTKARLEKSKR